jgi:hypothetical protein
MRSTLTIIISVVALIALGAGPAAAQSDVSPARADAAIHAQAMRAQGQHYNGRDLVTESSTTPAPVRIVHVTSAGSGFDWADAGIGAGLAAALLLTAAGVSTIRRQHPPMAAR